MPSASPNGGRVGGPSGSPVRAAKPLIASASVPNPGRRAYGPDLSERGHPGDHQARVGGVQHGRARGPSARACRAGSSRSARRRARPGGSSSVRALGPDRSRVTVRLLRPSVFHHRLTVPAGRGRGRRPARRVLDLDDVGAEVAEERRRERSGEQRRGVDDPHARSSGRRIGLAVLTLTSGPRRASRSQARRKPIGAERVEPSPASNSLTLNSGGCGPPSKYQSEPSATVARAALEDGEPRDAVGVLALGQVPHQRPGAARTRVVRGELPLVLGGQTGAARRAAYVATPRPCGQRRSAGRRRFAGDLDARRRRPGRRRPSCVSLDAACSRGGSGFHSSTKGAPPYIPVSRSR